MLDPLFSLLQVGALLFILWVQSFLSSLEGLHGELHELYGAIQSQNRKDCSFLLEEADLEKKTKWHIVIHVREKGQWVPLLRAKQPLHPKRRHFQIHCQYDEKGS